VSGITIVPHGKGFAVVMDGHTTSGFKTVEQAERFKAVLVKDLERRGLLEPEDNPPLRNSDHVRP
jgi:hypothetical protein